MGNLFEYFLIAITGMFVVINPLTTAFVFASLTPYHGVPERERIARRAAYTSTFVLFTFAALGSVIFQVFGITLAAFRIAGGIILFGIGIGMLQRSAAPDHDARDAEPSGTISDDISIVPLSIPFISGPGAIATTMILTKEAPDSWHVVVVFIAVLVTTISCYFSMVHATQIIRVMGDSGRRVLTKLFGLILAVIAVQFVLNGISDFVIDGLPALRDALD
jgi:multiple antibiotic resistance protein